MKVTEIILMPDISKDNADMIGGEMLGTNIDENPDYKLFFKYAGNHVYQYSDSEHTTYLIVNAQGTITGVAMTVPYSSFEQVVSIQATNDNTLRLADFYHLLVLKGKTLVSDYMQTPGGRKVWQKLATMPGIKVQAWDHKNKKIVRTPITDVYVDTMDDEQMKTKSKMQGILLIAKQK